MADAAGGYRGRGDANAVAAGLEWDTAWRQPAAADGGSGGCRAGMEQGLAPAHGGSGDG